MRILRSQIFKGVLEVVLLSGVLFVPWRPAMGQKVPERFWLAGRYDGNRVVIFFDAVQFEGTMAPVERIIAPPAVDNFFEPVGLPTSYIERFQKEPDKEKFKLGDRYDLLDGGGLIGTVKLTTLIGCETDEGVGNDSFIGALGTVEKGSLFLTRGYYVVKRHPGAISESLKSKVHIGLFDSPVGLDLETEIAALLTQQMKLYAADSEKAAIKDAPPGMRVQAFRIADGSMRYYAQAEWKRGMDPEIVPMYIIAAWLKAEPKPQILAVEKPRPSVDVGPGYVPKLLNVIDLEAGRTGVILDLLYGETTELKLAKYQDGATAASMPILQSISAGE